MIIIHCGIKTFGLTIGVSWRNEGKISPLRLKTLYSHTPYEPMKTRQPKEIVRETIPEGMKRAVFASGCFWCLEATMEATHGVVSAINGYGGGEEFNPTYEDVYTGRTGHKEAVMVYYDPRKTNYEKLLEVFWGNIDPTDNGGQFLDRGPSYTTAIFYETDKQRQQAEISKAELTKSGAFNKPIVTDILPYITFYEAEEYHQSFYRKSPHRYQAYSQASGRQQFKELIWREIQKESNPKTT